MDDAPDSEGDVETEKEDVQDWMFSTFHKGKPKQNSKKVQLPNAIISNEFDPFASEDSMLPDEQSAKK